MKASYRLSLEALADVERIYRFGLQHFGEAQADRFFHQLFDKFDEIAEQPFLFQTVDEVRTGYRRAVFAGNSIYFRLAEDAVEIMAVIGQQDIGGRL